MATDATAEFEIAPQTTLVAGREPAEKAVSGMASAPRSVKIPSSRYLVPDFDSFAIVIEG
jgi:hypothetical protein